MLYYLTLDKETTGASGLVGVLQMVVAGVSGTLLAGAFKTGVRYQFIA